MAHEHLVKWGKEAFERGTSLEHIENYLLKRGLKREEALKALHQITAFEHRIHQDIQNIRRALLSIPILLLLILSGVLFLYFAGILKTR